MNSLKTKIEALREKVHGDSFEKQSFKELYPEIMEDNRKHLYFYSSLVSVPMIIMFILSYVIESLEKNRLIYTVVAAICILLWIFTAKYRSRAFSVIAMYSFVTVLFVFGILLGTVIEPNETSVSFPILLFAVPLLFTDNPKRMNLAVFIGIVLYCVGAFLTQDSLMIQYNLTNVIPYGVLAMLTCSLVMRMKINRVELQKKSDEINETLISKQAELEDRQSELEEAVSENEAQIKEITALNMKIQDQKEQVAEAYGITVGFTREYHTIWLVDKNSRRIRLIRSSGVGTIKNAVQTGLENPDFDTALEKYIDSYVMPEDRERLYSDISFEKVMDRLSKEDLYSVNYQRRTEEGEIGYHQITFANADADDGKKQFVFGFRDVDQLIKAEKAQKMELSEAKEAAEAANLAKSAFLFNMSHDIRTPMNAIIGFRDLLEKNQDNPEKRKDYLKKIDEASNVLLSIINNVLEMSRIEKGTVELDETAWSVDQLCDSIVSVFEGVMASKDIRFTTAIDVKNEYFYCDTTKLNEIFFNILSNSYKYTPAGGSVDFSLVEIPSEKEGYSVFRTSITDTGIGMSEEFIPHIFEEFSRETNSTENKIEGTGLGMPIVKRLLDLMNGTIEVKSEKGVGSTFTVTIPLRKANRNDLLNNESCDKVQKRFDGKRVLLAEDNDLNAEIATEILKEAGLSVERAEDGKICLDMLTASANGYYTLILMDIQMPNMNGYDSARAIRQLDDKEKADIPIIAMTANAFEEDKREALLAGMNSHVSKPINVSDLFDSIAKVL